MCSFFSVSWSWTKYSNTKCVGFDKVGHKTGQNETSCTKYCDCTEGCHYFTLHRSRGDCYLFSDCHLKLVNINFDSYEKPVAVTTTECGETTLAAEGATEGSEGSTLATKETTAESGGTTLEASGTTEGSSGDILAAEETTEESEGTTPAAVETTARSGGTTLAADKTSEGKQTEGSVGKNWNERKQSYLFCVHLA